MKREVPLLWGRFDRGQTTLDFAIGTSLFLLVFASIFIFVVGTLQPFAQGNQDEIVSANRVADSLSEGLLGDPATPHVLNVSCTQAFFEGVNGGPPSNPPEICGYQGGELSERLGIKDQQFAAVTVRGDLSNDGDGTDILCLDSSNELAEHDNCSGTELQIGASPPQQSGTVVKARRVVQINETDAILTVEVW